MARRRFFVDEVRRGEAELTGDAAEHLTRVLRAEPGQQYEISDGAGLYVGEIVEARKRSVKFRVVETLPVPTPAVRVLLLASLIKFERFEWMVEKATELGVDTIIPVQSDRSEKGLELAARKRVERWRRVARAAGQQSRRVHLPRILAPIPFREAVRAEARARFYLEEIPGSPPLLSALLALPDRQPGETIAILVGPEGGWTDRERAEVGRDSIPQADFQSAALEPPAPPASARLPWTAVTLGSNILRAETAALAAVALVSSVYFPPITSSAF
jgi:16S rRNA (uracil1498-N3)-methyltransferase